MYEYFWNIIGVAGLFGFLFFAICVFILGVFLKRKSRPYILGSALCLVLFIISTLLFPGEEEIAEEIANPVKVYQRGVENEKRGAFKRAKKDYEVVLSLDPQNEETIKKMQLIERREIALTFLQVARKLRRKGKPARALVKLKIAEKIAPPPGTLEDKGELKDKIKREIMIVQQLIAEKSVGGASN